ncbi:helix-turn-helix transcriptional regulator [Oscillospiraceae bacterium 38-13]
MGTFSENLKLCRKRRDVSQEVAAVSCKIAYSTYRRYETGEREPNLSTLCTFADYFGVTLDQLAGRTPLPFLENPQP